MWIFINREPRMPNATITRAVHGEQSLDEVLHAIHRAWLDEARRYLVPVLDPGADFWTRWAAVRYLADNFRERYRWERALVDDLRSLLEPGQAERLQRLGDRLLQLRLEVDRIGRRRGTAAEAAPAVRELLEHVELWCSEIELGTSGLTREVLPAEASALLARLEAILPAQP